MVNNINSVISIDIRLASCRIVPVLFSVDTKVNHLIESTNTNAAILLRSNAILGFF